MPCCIRAGFPSRPWNVSLGVPLSDWPLAHAALLLLELACGPLSIHRVGLLLRSPFVGGAESERNARALLDAKLRRLGDPHITLDGLIRHAGAEGHAYSCGMLADRLAALRARLRELPASAQRVSYWGPALQSLLSAMQWPGERELNSEEYQTFKKWKEIIAGLAQLDVVSAPVRLSVGRGNAAGSCSRRAVSARDARRADPGSGCVGVLSARVRPALRTRAQRRNMAASAAPQSPLAPGPAAKPWCAARFGRMGAGVCPARASRLASSCSTRHLQLPLHAGRPDVGSKPFARGSA